MVDFNPNLGYNNPYYNNLGIEGKKKKGAKEGTVEDKTKEAPKEPPKEAPKEVLESIPDKLMEHLDSIANNWRPVTG